MTDPEETAEPEAGARYRAFISYSHRDKRWGDWLHKALETYRVPRKLVGTESRDGAVPKRLFPVFRDREELPGSPDLGHNITEALKASRYLVVICSPRAAGSLWVNEEIKYFKSLGREHRVLCMIVEGEPNATDRPDSGLEECFPEAVRYKVASDGRITDERTEPIAADARPGQDGPHNARLKLLAGLLGVDYDKLRQRERIRRRQRRSVQAAAVLVLAAGIGVAWHLVDEARIERRVEQSNRLARESLEATRSGEAHRGLRLALQALPPDLERADWPVPALAFAALQRAYTANRLVAELDGHEARLNAVAYGAEGRRLLSTDGNGVTHLWDPAAGSRVARLAADDPWRDAWFTRDGRRVVLYGYRGGRARTKIVDAANGDTVAEHELGATHHNRQWNLGGSRTRVALVAPAAMSSDHRITVHDAATGERMLEHAPSAGAIDATAFLRGGRVLIVHAAGVSLLGPAIDGERRIELATGGVQQMAADTANRHLAIDFGDDGVALLDLEAGTVLWHKAEVTPKSMTLSPEGDRLYVDDAWRSRVLDARTGAERDESAPGLVHAIHDDPRILAGGHRTPGTGTVSLAYPDAAYAGQWPGHEAGVTATAIAPGGRHLATGGRDHGVRLWDARPAFAAWAPPPGPDAKAVPGPDGALVWHDTAGGLYRQDEALGEVERIAQQAFEGYRSVHWLPSGNAIVETIETGGAMNRRAVIRWRAYPDGRLLHETPETPVNGDPLKVASAAAAIAFTSARGRLSVLRGGPDGVSTHRFEMTPGDGAEPARIRAFAIAPSGERVAAALEGGEIRVLAVDTGEVVQRFRDREHDTAFPWSALAFGPDGQHLAASDDSRALDIWSLGEPGEPTRIRSASVGASVRFSPDGRHVMTAGFAAPGLGIWDLRGRSVALHEGIDRLERLQPAPDGSGLLHTGQPVRLIDAGLGEAKPLKCGDGRAEGARWGPRGRYVATYRDARICVFNTAAGVNVAEYANHAARPRQVLFRGAGGPVWSISDRGTHAWPLYRDRASLLERARDEAQTIEAGARQ